jgi:hypothetical protein
MKTYTFTTKNVFGEEIKTYTTEQFSLTEAKKYAKNIIANSMMDEVSITRIKLLK